MLEHLVEELSLQSHVRFAGQVAGDDLADYYRLCDVFAMPNREMPDGDTEGFRVGLSRSQRLRQAGRRGYRRRGRGRAM